MAQPPAAGSSVNRDLGYKLDAFVSIPSNLGNNTTDGTGLACNLKGYEGAVALIHFGVSGDTLSGSVKALVSVQDSANGTTGWVDLAATKMRIDSALDVTTAAVWTRDTAFADIDAAAEDDVLYKVTILPGAGVRQYVRALITFTGTHTVGTPISALFIKGFSRIEAAV